jgi:hypothetical protein
MSSSIFYGVALDFSFALLSTSQIALYSFEIFATINIYNKLKEASEECGERIHSIPVVRADGRLSLDVFA